MKIAIVIGSRADAPGQIAIANALAEKGVEVFGVGLDGMAEYSLEHMSLIIKGTQHRCMPYIPDDCDAVVLLGDRYEIAQTALEYRQACVPYAHVHAGELTGQDPDDTYRDMISRMATWLFVPHDEAEQRISDLCMLDDFGGCGVSHNCGSPFITSAANTELIDVEWPEGKGCNCKDAKYAPTGMRLTICPKHDSPYIPKVFVAFNSLPEDKDETRAIANTLAGLWKCPYRFVIINANTDRHRDILFPNRNGCYPDNTKWWRSLTHQEYLSYLATADVVVGNTSAILVENSYFGTPSVLIGTRQQYRVHGEHVLHRKPAEIEDAIREALDMGRRPNTSYGDKESANRIAETLINEIKGMGKTKN